MRMNKPCASLLNFFYPLRYPVAILLSLIILFPRQALADECIEPLAPMTFEVLTLNEAACLLKVDSDVLVNLVEAGRLPGKRIGRAWRFSRTAIFNWLAEESNMPVPKALPLQIPASKIPLAQIVGKGVNDSIETRSGDERKNASIEALGEAPDLGTAEDIFLRDQVLLKTYHLTLELGISYTKSEQKGLRIINIGSAASSDLLSISSEGDAEIFASSYSLRLGLPNDLQLFASAPYTYQENTQSTPATVITDATESTTSQSEVGNISFGFRKTLLKAKKNTPDIIVNLQSQIPTHSSGYGLGSGFSLVKRIDPVVLFASLNYLRMFNQNKSDPARLQPDNIFSGAFGYALSLNETLAISISASGTFTSKSTFDFPGENTAPITLLGQERFNLNLGLTALLTEGLYIEPNLSFSLNGPSVVTLGLSLPYTFDLSD